jgi:hypothetical protein
LAVMKSCILLSYCSIGSITSALLLSAFTIMASLRLSFVLMGFIVLVSDCVCCVFWG